MADAIVDDMHAKYPQLPKALVNSFLSQATILDNIAQKDNNVCDVAIVSGYAYEVYVKQNDPDSYLCSEMGISSTNVILTMDSVLLYSNSFARSLLGIELMEKLDYYIEAFV